jgi:hypothetical protein
VREVEAGILDELGEAVLHEWLLTDKGYVKTDAVDHCRDHFFPGSQDIAWDVAGACVEFRLSSDARRYLCERYVPKRRDPALAARLPFFLVAYLAFQLGYATMAAANLKGAEAGRFRQLAQTYSRQLHCALAEARE